MFLNVKVDLNVEIDFGQRIIHTNAARHSSFDEIFKIVFADQSDL